MSGQVSGNIAVLMLPDDGRLHIQLSRYFYASTLAKIRREVEGNRSGIIVFEVAAPINAPVIHIAMDRRSGYLLGFRTTEARHWWAFKEEDKPVPTLPGLPSQPMGLTGSYTELDLPPSINMRPEALLSRLASFSGRGDVDFYRAIVLLLFLVAEAMRFESLLFECQRYFGAESKDAYTIHPATHEGTVTNWKKSLPGDPNVLLHHIPS
ncbi:MAG: ribosome-inactivating family protein [Pseudomonadota bacterium]